MEEAMSLKSKFKRLFSGVLSLAVIASVLPSIPAAAEEAEKYPYSVFGRNGITMSASSNLCMNGNMHTNKNADISYMNGNINGSITTGSDIEKRVKHVYSDQKIMETYFTENCDLHEEEYVYSDMNIHINNPLFCYNNITLDGNVSLNSNLGTLMNLNITGEVKNANTSVVYSKYGNITIENDSTANINGLIYVPLGTLTINSPNINLNGVIIADKIVINGSSVNINYKDDIAGFIGNTSEVYDFSGLEYLPEEWLGDTDEDELFDIYEKVIDTDPLNPDTDGDGLPDGYEVITLNTDPLEIDTDENGISDADEDFDSDNLNNLGEYQNGTDPFNPDTDEDGFMDGDEVYTYGTDPLNPDTDNDGLLDGEESYNGSIYAKYGMYFDPLNPDTNGNGVLDGEEVFGQSKKQEVETHDEAITEISVDMDTNGSLERNLTIESMYNIDAMSSNVYAMIGEPFNFTSSTNFESATITFKIDQSKLGDTLFDNLIILWYNEEEQIFEEMPTTRDAVNSTVSTTTTHFSQYMVVDSQKWYANWNYSLSELRRMWISGTSYQRNLHTILMMDCSSSAYSSDPYNLALKVGYNGVTSENIEDIRNSINSQWDAEHYCVKSCDRFDICDGIINNKGSNDAVALITFAGGVVSNSGWIYSKGSLRNALAQNIGNYGGTGSWRSAINTALGMVETDTTDIYRIVIISDTNANSGVISSDEFASNVILNVVNVGTGSFSNNIEAVAQATGGDVYNAISASDLTYQSGGFITSPEQFVGTDSDGDGIPDLVELYGLKPNGDPINTNPNKKDTDGDGIDDNIELCYIGSSLTSDVTMADYVRALKPHSDPAKADSDGDGFGDDIDPNCLVNDIKKTTLNNSNYVSIFDTDNNINSFGGNQEWFEKLEYDTFCNGNVSANFAKSNGCGLIAGGDMLLYLNLYKNFDMKKYAEILGCNKGNTTVVGGGLELYEYAGYNNSSGVFGQGTYLKYMQLLSNKLTISTGMISGVWPAFIPSSYNGAINDAFEVCGIDYTASWNFSCSQEKCKKDIKRMLSNDIPVVFAYYSNDDELNLYESTDLTNFTLKQPIKSHYMVITGIIEFSDGVVGITKHKTLYEVSSWGKKYYIDAETYLSNLSPFSNILNIYE